MGFSPPWPPRNRPYFTCDYLEIHNRSESDRIRLMNRHASKCVEMKAKGKRLVHTPYGKKGAIYVPIEKYGLAFSEDFKSEPVDDTESSTYNPNLSLLAEDDTMTGHADFIEGNNC